MPHFNVETDSIILQKSTVYCFPGRLLPDKVNIRVHLLGQDFASFSAHIVIFIAKIASILVKTRRFEHSRNLVA